MQERTEIDLRIEQAQLMDSFFELAEAVLDEQEGDLEGLTELRMKVECRAVSAFSTQEFGELVLIVNGHLVDLFLAWNKAPVPDRDANAG
ncbi:hypothetical protein [Roseibium polysiphoniae]|nr:hypothetical protein [Roseibium polysiphoniae]